MPLEHSTAMDKIKETCMHHGVSGIKDFVRTFRGYKKNRSRKLAFNEFLKGLEQYGCPLAAQEVMHVFSHFDQDRTGTIDLEEFLNEVRPTMSLVRENLVTQAFNKMDADSSGEITLSDLKKLCNVTKNPKYLSGDMSAGEVFQVFLDGFQASEDGVISKDEWFDYYSGVSACVEKDVLFDFMMRQTWKI